MQGDDEQDQSFEPDDEENSDVYDSSINSHETTDIEPLSDMDETNMGSPQPTNAHGQTTDMLSPASTVAYSAAATLPRRRRLFLETPDDESDSEENHCDECNYACE